MDIAADDVLGEAEHRPDVIGEEYLGIGSELFIQSNVIHSGKGVLNFLAEELAVSLLAQHILIGIDALRIQIIVGDEVIADLVGRIAQLDIQLIEAPGDALEQQGKPITGKDRQYDTGRTAREFAADIRRYLVHSGIIALCAGNGGFRYGEDIAVARGKAFRFCRAEHAIDRHAGKIIALFEDRGAYAAYYCTDCSHCVFLFSCAGGN